MKEWTTNHALIAPVVSVRAQSFVCSCLFCETFFIGYACLWCPRPSATLEPMLRNAIIPGGHGSHGTIARFTLEDFRKAREFTYHLLIACSLPQYNETEHSWHRCRSQSLRMSRSVPVGRNSHLGFNLIYGLANQSNQSCYWWGSSATWAVWFSKSKTVMLQFISADEISCMRSLRGPNSRPTGLQLWPCSWIAWIYWKSVISHPCCICWSFCRMISQ